MRHAMIDLETLGTSAGARILSIGACRFDPDRGTVGAYLSLPINDHLGIIDPDTVKWWLGQSEEARKAAVEGMDAAKDPLGSPLSVIEAIIQWAGKYTDEEGVDYPEVEFLWSNGPSFDEALLLDFFNRYGQKARWPFKYYGSRDFRTVVDLADFGRPDYTKPEVPHMALADAVAQADTVMRALAKVRKAVRGK